MVVTTRLLLAILLSAFLLSAANAVRDYQGQQGQYGQRGTPLTQAQQCRLQRLTASHPTDRIESEGGVTELWDENEEQFQCAGVAPMRLVVRRNSLSLPNFHPMPRLLYVERGQGILGITHPGCAETFQSQPQTFQAGREPRVERGQGRRGDQHQKLHRIRQGDIVAIPAGAAHWAFNDGEEEFVAIMVNDLNHRSNQLDQNMRAFYLAGGVPESGRQRTQSGLRRQQSTQRFQNIFRAFDTELMAEAFNIPQELVRRMQEEQSERGLIVNVREGMSMIRSDEEEEEEFEERPRRGQQWWEGVTGNGLEENICTMKIHTNIETQRQADVYSRQAGKVNHVGRIKLPVLKYIDMSASKVNLYPNALFSPHWTLTGHSVLYVQRGDAQVQVVDHSGQQVMNDRVNQGEIFVVPQYFPATLRAGQNGFEFVVFRTSSQPMNNQLAGYTSVIRAMPVEVLTNAYQISLNQAQRLKTNRGGESLLLSPQRRFS